jgi:hypothetical protein
MVRLMNPLRWFVKAFQKTLSSLGWKPSCDCKLWAVQMIFTPRDLAQAMSRISNEDLVNATIKMGLLSK